MNSFQTLLELTSRALELLRELRLEELEQVLKEREKVLSCLEVPTGQQLELVTDMDSRFVQEANLLLARIGERLGESVKARETVEAYRLGLRGEAIFVDRAI
jgi:hypothetical protein